jgi:predicted DNA-binding WGR domain protein
MTKTHEPRTKPKSPKKRQAQAHHDFKQDPNYVPNWDMTNNREPNQEEEVVKHHGSSKAKIVLVAAGPNRKARRHPYVNHRNIFTKKYGPIGSNIIKGNKLVEYFVKKAEAVKKYKEELTKKKNEVMAKVKKQLEDKEKKLTKKPNPKKKKGGEDVQ